MIRVNLLAEARPAAPRGREAAPAVAVPGRTKRWIFLGCLALGLAYVAVTWFHLASVKRDYDDKIRRAQQEVDRLKSIIDEVNGYEKKKADLEAKINLINDLKRNQKGPVRLMDEVSKALPDLVWLSEMDASGSTVAIRGQAMTPNAVANFIDNLKKSPIFSEPKFDNLTQSGGIYTFALSVSYAYGSPGAGGPSGASGPSGPAGGVKR